MRLIVRVLKWAAWALGGLFLLLLLAYGGYLVWDAVTPKTYYFSPASFRAYEKAGVPEAVVEKLWPHYGRDFTSEAAFTEGLKEILGAQTYARYADVLHEYRREDHCWPNTSPVPVHVIDSSTDHPLYNAFTTEPVRTADRLPEIPAQLVFLPAGGALVLGQTGQLARLDADWQPLWQVDLPGTFKQPAHQGALGLTLHPDFADNRLAFIAYVTEDGRTNVVQRFRLGEGPQGVLDSRVDILRTPKDDTHPYHGISTLSFTDRGTLLVLVGDPTDHAQTPWDFQGKLLELLPRTGPQGGYDDPPLGLWERMQSWAHLRPAEVAASGLRSPYSATLWDGKLVIGDVGGNGPWSFEMVKVYNERGQNFGWGACGNPHLMADYVPSVLTYRRSDPRAVQDHPTHPEVEARSVIVGMVYERGASSPYGEALEQRLIYADYYIGFVRGARLNDRGHVQDDVFLAHDQYVSDMAVGPDGYIYLLHGYGNDGIRRLVPRSGP